ncbi:MAG: cytochrome c [Thermaceae bacterium]|nr:cytochrome c [Thermaceae bacterium]
MLGLLAQPSSVYNQCAGCHQSGGTGLAGAFPPLAGHVSEILSAKGGRDYIIQLLLYGLQGEITVGGAKYNGVMPAFAQLKDEQIAAVLNHIATQWGNDKMLPADHKAFTADDVKAFRDKKLTAAQVYDLRKTLGLK